MIPDTDAGRLLPFRMTRQPTLTTCGPSCLHSVYAYWKDEAPLEQVVREVGSIEGGGTLGVLLGLHALRRGYEAVLYTYNLRLFDPTWFVGGRGVDLAERLRLQARRKKNRKLQTATRAYLEYLAEGGQVRYEDITMGLLRRYLNRGLPILTGLSSTFLYGASRERQDTMEDDDLGGEPTGHFVVLCGYRHDARRVIIADPYHPNPFSVDHLYEVPMPRALGAILLGAVTFDGNLLILRPRGDAARSPGEDCSAPGARP